MSNQRNHINIFEELIRILNLKKQTHIENFDNVIFSSNIIYSPGKDKSKKVINELTTYQNKINKRKRIHRFFYSILVSGILLLSILIYDKNSQIIEEQNQNSPIIQEENINAKKTDSVISESDTVKLTNTRRNIDETNITVKAKPIKKDPVKSVVSDTVHKIIIKLDTLFEEVIITDTIHKNHYESKVKLGLYCSFPKKYRIQFNEKSVLVDNKYNNDILKLSNEILNCQNLNDIEIIGYYSQRFLFFNNKKKVLERIENIKKEIKKHNVSSRTLRKSKENLIKIAKSNKLDSSHLVEIIFKD